MAHTFPHVEDYIEFIGGYRDLKGSSGIFHGVQSNGISLARYDVAIVDSFCQQTAYNRNPYTEKQAALAQRIVDKYRKQLSKHGVDVPETLDKFRLGIRKIDYARAIYIENQKILVKSPYDAKLIESVRSMGKVGPGQIKFDHDTKIWHLDMNEHMLNWIMSIAPTFGFTVSSELQDLYAKLLEVEQEGYAIELVDNGIQLEITNAADSLIEYVQENLGGFGPDNLLTLVDNAPVLGYTVNPELMRVFEAAYGNAKEYSQRTTSYKTGEKTFEEVMSYARQVNRLPVYVYQPGLPRENTDEIVYLNGRASADVRPKLLVTTTSLMIGAKRQSWLVNSEKIIILA